MDAAVSRCSFAGTRSATRAAACLVALWAGGLGSAATAGSWEMRVCADPDYLPFSKRDLSGYENRIAAILAEEMDADLTFAWRPQTPKMVSEMLREGRCDMIMGVPDSKDSLLPTIAYYQSPYVFVQRADAPEVVSTFDDEALRHLRLGVQVSNDMPHAALAKRGLGDQVKYQPYARQIDPDGPFAPLIEAVADGSIDVAVPWGPVGGYYASRQPVPLRVTPAPPFDFPFEPMYLSIVIGVRRGDEALRDRLDIAIARRWDEIQAVLAEYGVPTMPMVRPVVGGETQ